MKTREIVAIALLLWFIYRSKKPSTDVNLLLTEPGFEGMPVGTACNCIVAPCNCPVS